MAKTGGVRRDHASSHGSKTVFAALHLISILICGWLLCGGWSWIGRLAGLELQLADPVRGALVFGCAILYFARHLLTLFYLLQRRLAYSEVFGLALFIAVFEIGFLLLGAGAFRETAMPLGPVDLAGAGLVPAGSFLNSYSEFQRKIWKQDPAHRGHCYTGGLFGYSMHINYFGDAVLFTGWALLTHSFFALAVPAFMTFSFICFHIPALDAYLLKRYGKEFEDYAARTKKLVPFLY